MRVSGSPYFTENFGQPFKMWDATITYNYMPKTWLTWWAEIGYRHSDQPYWSGRGRDYASGRQHGLSGELRLHQRHHFRGVTQCQSLVTHGIHSFGKRLHCG